MNNQRLGAMARQLAFVFSVFIVASNVGNSWAQSVNEAATEAANETANETADEAEQVLSEAEIEQLVAPIALHPDALLSQILMASTYPLEVVEAARWTKANPDMAGEALETALEDQAWDPSVKALAPYPQVLDMMNSELSWTQQLGDAFLAQQEDVLDAVQRLRAQADAAGNLASTEQQTVTKEPITTEAGETKTVIVVEQADPEIIYVPAYNPTIVYGAWAYPAYPPYYWYPPGYVASRVIWFGAGVAVRQALWGGCNWHNNNVKINVNVYNRYNRTKIKNTNWNHNPRHRKAVPYRSQKVARQYGKRPENRQNIKSREQFRGRAEAGRRDLAKRPAVKAPAKRPAAKAPAKRPAAKAPAKRPAAKAPAKRPAQAKRPQQRKQPAAYKGIGNGKKVKKQSARGKKSRGSARSRGGGRRPQGGGRRR